MLQTQLVKVFRAFGFSLDGRAERLDWAGIPFVDVIENNFALAISNRQVQRMPGEISGRYFYRVEPRLMEG